MKAPKGFPQDDRMIDQPDDLVILSSCHLVILSSCHLVILSSCHLVIHLPTYYHNSSATELFAPHPGMDKSYACRTTACISALCL